MRNKLGAIMGVVICLAALGVQAGDPAPEGRVGILPKGSEVFNVIYKSEQQSDVIVSIYDAKDQLVFTERFRKQTNFLRPYNFSGLNFGKYTIEVVDDKGTLLKQIDYAKVKTTKMVNVVKVSNSSNDSKYLFMVSGRGEELIRLKIYDINGHLLHNEARLIAGDDSQVYTLKGISSGCTFEVIHKDGSVRQLRYP